mgnify:CR=1 FL=1
MIAFVRAVHGVRQIWVKNLAGGDQSRSRSVSLLRIDQGGRHETIRLSFTLGSIGRDDSIAPYRIEVFGLFLH